MHAKRCLGLLSAIVASLAALPAAAQNAPLAAPVKPYTPVAITLPKPISDPGFDLLRQKITEAAERKDRAALSRLVVAKGFFWDRENGDAADKRKSGMDNLATALGIGNREGSGWDMLATYADDPNASPSVDHKGAVCAPADPAFDNKAFQALLEQTETDVAEWGYPLAPAVDVRAGGDASAAVVDKLGLYFVRVMPDSITASPSFIRIVLPDGKSGYVSIDSIAPMGNDQICYVLDGNAWKIGGYIGGGEP